MAMEIIQHVRVVLFKLKKISYSRVAFVKDKHLKEQCQVSILEKCFSEMSILGLKT